MLRMFAIRTLQIASETTLEQGKTPTNVFATWSALRKTVKRALCQSVTGCPRFILYGWSQARWFGVGTCTAAFMTGGFRP